MKYDPNVIKPPVITSQWRELVKPYQSSDTGRSVWMVINTVIPYIGSWALMFWSLSVSYWLTLALAPITAGFLMRTFIIMHDCGHGSFFKSPRANHIIGTITGILTHTPYFQWTREHAIHHASSGDLARRGVGDVNTLTVKEYQELPKWERLKYRLYRNPIVMFVIGPQYIFLYNARFASKVSGQREKNNLYLTNVALFAIYGSMLWAFGLKALLMVFTPMMLIAGAVGVWLFYVQHQYEDTYWQRGKDWDYATAALMGSSYYKLPRILQWFSGNIGFHHIHHLGPRIPNYKLEECHRATPMFQQSPTIHFWESFKTASLKLWDEEQQKMVRFPK